MAVVDGSVWLVHRRGPAVARRRVLTDAAQVRAFPRRLDRRTWLGLRLSVEGLRAACAEPVGAVRSPTSRAPLASSFLSSSHRGGRKPAA